MPERSCAAEVLRVSDSGKLNERAIPFPGRPGWQAGRYRVHLYLCNFTCIICKESPQILGSNKLPLGNDVKGEVCKNSTKNLFYRKPAEGARRSYRTGIGSSCMARCSSERLAKYRSATKLEPDYASQERKVDNIQPRSEMVRPEGVEPPTCGSEDRCSIQLS